jgi:hypothetical protein
MAAPLGCAPSGEVFLCVGRSPEASNDLGIEEIDSIAGGVSDLWLSGAVNGRGDRSACESDEAADDR